ncbi:MAG TPA: SDR family oxidoreductase [Candidatus Binatia bacterium]|nr:SDR family oxidoreductase [Candidatus Binatia bacterium]
MGGSSRSVVVTGGTAGVGRAIALRFAQGGDRVCVVGRAQSGVDATVREIEATGAEAFGVAADVSEWQSLFNVADQVAERWGGIDVWVNNAMVTMFAPVAEMTGEEYERITGVTYLGYVYGTMAALKHMRARKRGVIVQIGSALSYRAIPLQSAYCGAKFAVRAFTDALRSELIHDGSNVRLTMLQLPAINTPQFNWARNRMGGAPRPVPPVFEPEHVADIAFKAARDAPREVWIGWPTLKLIAGAIAVPGYLDRYLAKAGYEGQVTRETETDPEGNLFEAKPSGHAARGRFTHEAKPAPPAFNPTIISGGIMLGALVAAAFLLALGD